MLRLLYAFSIACMLVAPKLVACGYDFVGGCSTDITLGINGTPGLFAIAPCAYETSFHGQELGALRSLAINNARAITWESCINNVTDVKLFFSIREMDLVPSGGLVWRSISLKQDTSTLEGPYTTRYRSAKNAVDLFALPLMNYQVGKKYVLEVYFEASVDTIGDDFKPETTIRQDNNGQYYNLSFVYGGPSASPIALVVTDKQDAQCHGDSSGRVEIKVFGASGEVFYKWSAFTQNFYKLFHLPAGDYTVTVTDSKNISQTADFSIAQPPPLQIDFSSVTPAACNGQSGQAVAVASGGWAPYSYLWSSGDTGQVGRSLVPGNLSVSITDANGCKTSPGNVQIPGNLHIETQLVNRCDNRWDLTVSVVEGMAPYKYAWSDKDLKGPNEVLAAGTYSLTVSDAAGCSATWTTDLLPYDIKAQSSPATGIDQPNGSAFVVITNGTAPYDIRWNNGASGATILGLKPGQYCVTVKDAAACVREACVKVSSTIAQRETEQIQAQVYPNPAGPGAELQIVVPDFLQETAFHLNLYDGQGKKILARNGRLSSLLLPADLPPGLYALRIESPRFFAQKTIVVR